SRAPTTSARRRRRTRSSSCPADASDSRTIRVYNRRDVMTAPSLVPTRHDWSLAEIEAVYTAPLLDLLLRAQQTHREHHAPNRIQACTLLSIKTGGCPEDCRYCPQSAR